MTVVSVEQGADPEVLNAGLEDGSRFFFRLSYLDPLFVDSGADLLGRELSEGEGAALQLARDRFSAERAALRLIALREHSRAELSAKLAKRGFADGTTGVVLDRLVSEGLLDDGRFAELWVESRLARKNEGPALLIARLRARGVSRETARTAVGRAVGEQESLLVERFLTAEAGHPSRDDPDLRRRLLKAGFSPAAVREAFEKRS